MSLGVVACKVGGAGQCSSVRRRYPWQLCERPPPNWNLLDAWKRRGQRTGVKWNLRLQQLQAPSAAVASKSRHTLTKWMQLTVRATPKNCSTSPEQFGAKLDCNVEGAVDNKWQGHAMSSQLTPESGGQEYCCELLLWLPQCGSCGWKNCLQSPRWRKFAATNQLRLSETEVDHSQEGTRGQWHFLAWRGKPAKRELCKGVPFPDQYGCSNLDGTDPFSTLLSEHTGRLATGANPLRCLPLIDGKLEKS